MRSTASERLLNDHDEVGDVLTQLLAALHDKDVQASYAKLDLLWARLAVHIRAEHLHLFPTVLNRVHESVVEGVEFSQAEAVVENLRADHDFFMRELAASIGVLRELLKTAESAEQKARFTSILESVQKVEERLASHNEIEENQIYHWATTILTEPEQLALATRIDAELEHRPPRFSMEAWAND